MFVATVSIRILILAPTEQNLPLLLNNLFSLLHWVDNCYSAAVLIFLIICYQRNSLLKTLTLNVSCPTVTFLSVAATDQVVWKDQKSGEKIITRLTDFTGRYGVPCLKEKQNLHLMLQSISVSHTVVFIKLHKKVYVF